jgi:hypothetical protein
MQPKGEDLVTSGSEASKRRAARQRFRRAVRTLAVVALATGAMLIAAQSGSTAIVSGTTYTVTSVTSGKCVDARAAGTANGTAVQQYTCNGTGAQQWVFTATDSGYFRIGTAPAPTQVWDDSNVSSADGSLIHLWAYGGGTNQQWLPVQEGSGAYHFVNRFSGKCLDDTGGSTADSTQYQQWACSGGPNQSFNVAVVGSGGGGGPNPDLGPNVRIFDPTMSASSIQSTINSIYSSQQTNQFGTNRYALLFKPGTYNLSVPMGFYEQVAGLGLSPTQTSITGQGIRVDAGWFNGNATQNFWRSVENISDTPSNGTLQYAVSQATPFRRVDVHGNLQLYDTTSGNTSSNWSSGGYVADSRVSGQINSGTQQQFLTQDTQMGSWTGSNWNMVFLGDTGAPGTQFPSPGYTNPGATPTVREKPFLYVDASNNWNVFVPANRTNVTGPSWTSGSTAGSSLPLSQFAIIRPGDTATTMNNALASGQNLLITPGVYHLSAPLNITRANTIVLGLGLATLVPDNGVAAITTADVDGIDIAGIMVSANTTNSQTLVQIGPAGSSGNHSANPITLHDLFIRVGGDVAGRATQSLVINSPNTIGSDLWLWRADHGSGVGWNTNPAANGLIVNGANVTMYGLFVEHYQQYQTLWNANGGRTYFYQSEMPYDVPNNASWTPGGENGYPSYKVANSVTSHQAWGVGVYCFFSTNSSVVADRAFEVPASGSSFHDLVTVSLGGTGTISHIINNTGGAVNSGTTVQKIVSGP